MISKKYQRDVSKLLGKKIKHSGGNIIIPREIGCDERGHIVCKNYDIIKNVNKYEDYYYFVGIKAYWEHYELINNEIKDWKAELQ